MNMPPWRAALVLAPCLAWTSAQAFSCPEGSDLCHFAVGALTVSFLDGRYSFDGDSQLNGGDGFVRGYTVGTYDFPNLTAVQEGPGRVGFSFSPGMEGGVGGSGIVGEHEASAWLAFTNLRFESAPGWRVDGLEFTFTGERRVVGYASVALNLPATPVFNGDLFTAQGLAPADTSALYAGFSAWTVYEEDGEGGAASYGTAYARLDSVKVVALLSPVPEPATWSLALLGALGLASRTRAQRPARGGPG